MSINWYPGHMTKTMRMIEDNLKLIDCIVYVLDSRAPASCINPNFNAMVQRFPIIYALNKADLGDRWQVKLWVNKLSTEKSVAVAIDSTQSKSAKIVATEIKNLCREKLERNLAKGINRSLKAMVIGVPNTGKSTLINNLCGSGKTLTGDRPGVTRGKQWVRVSDYLEVLDTPGTLYPKLSDEVVARRLAYLGSIKDEVIDVLDLAENFVKEAPSDIIKARYNCDISDEKGVTIENIARSKGYIMKGNNIDYDRTANAIIDDFRKGRLGKITLDKVDDYNDKFGRIR